MNWRYAILSLLQLGGLTSVVAAAPPVGMTMQQAVATALSRNHDVIAAKLELRAAEFDRVQAQLYPNPIFGYALGNLVLGHANPQGSPGIRSPSMFGQTVHTFSISEIIDIWGKRSGRIQVADRSIAVRRLQAQDAIRDIVYAVRSAFADVAREQSELQLSQETRARYDETVRLSRSRFAAGDISDAELKKIELEGLRYQNTEVDAEMQLDLAREQLAALLALSSEAQLPPLLVDQDDRRPTLTLGPLVERALTQRPDVLAAREAKLLSGDTIASAKREAYPDVSLGLTYTHSEFTVSGDNPNTWGLTVSVPLPLSDRNQANLGRARVQREQAENAGRGLLVVVKHEVADAFRRSQRAHTLLDALEGGMLGRAESSLNVAEKSYRAGSSSLLELLEAQRTYLDTRADYLRILYDYRQAAIDLMHATGGEFE